MFLFAGGYVVYDTVFNVDISDATEIKEKKIAEIPLSYDALDQRQETRQICSIMDDNDAAYYKIKIPKDVIRISQVNKDKFNSTGPISSQRCYRLITNGMKHFLNSSYDKLPENLYESETANERTIFGKISYYGSKKELKNTFGMGIRKMFTKYELSLSCQDISVSKMAVFKTGEISIGSISYSATDSYANIYRYYFVVNAKVKTMHAKGKISRLGVFAKEGKTKKIQFFINCSTDDSFKSLSIDSLKIK